MRLEFFKLPSGREEKFASRIDPENEAIRELIIFFAAHGGNRI
jgi:hypothetical protein